MDMKLENLTVAGKEELALALLLWKDFKCQGKIDVEIVKQVTEFTELLGVTKEFHKIQSLIPPMKIEERYP